MDADIPVTRHYGRWTPRLDEEFTALVRQELSNVEIAQILGRTVGSIGNRKNKLGLAARLEFCAHCAGPIEHARTGHPRRFCSNDCVAAARRAVAEVAAQARVGRLCAHPDCSNPLPTTNVRQRYCSRLCCARIHELTYCRPGKKLQARLSPVQEARLWPSMERST